MQSESNERRLNTTNQEVRGILPTITETLKENLAVDPLFAMTDFVPTSEELFEYRRVKGERSPRR